MSEQNKNNVNTSQGPAGPDSQSQRWLKYGSNVLLSVVLVIALAFGAVWLAQRAPKRVDMTGGSLSLKPQSVAVVGALKEKITLVSLYTRPDGEPDMAAQAQRVSDLLDEYKTRSSKIDVRVIDPAKEKDKLEELHQEFLTRYGGEIKNYTDYLDEWKVKVDRLKQLTNDEVKAISPFADESGIDESVAADLARTVSEFAEELSNTRKAVDKELTKKHPDYKAAANTASKQTERLSSLAAAVVTQAPEIQQDPRTPAPFKAYLTASRPHFEEIKKIADELKAKSGKLGELKVDQLEQALTVEDPILVLGEKDWRILPKAKVWQKEADARAWGGSTEPPPRFAGEQQITTAIYTLDNPKKQKVCFVRPAGGPLAQAGRLEFAQGGLRQVPPGPFMVIASRLADYNFEVLEKDISGQYAMQAQMQRMPVPPEPTDEEIKDAIWIVVDFPMGDAENPAPPSQLAPKLKAHLDAGGSALVLCLRNADNLAAALKDWGVELHPEAAAVHQTIKLTEAAMRDPFEKIKAQAEVFDCRNYGDHPIVNPIRNLDAVIYQSLVVKTHDVPGCTVTPLLPLSDNTGGLPTWGETNREQLEKSEPVYNPDKGDLPPPIYGGAAVEKKGARLVVFGSPIFVNQLLFLPDPKLRERGILVNSFPGNQELTTNSMFWLAHLDSMIAISPSAMDVSRISDMSQGWLHFWRIGVLLVLLPGAVLAAGVFMFYARRD